MSGVGGVRQAFAEEVVRLLLHGPCFCLPQLNGGVERILYQCTSDEDHYDSFDGMVVGKRVIRVYDPSGMWQGNPGTIAVGAALC